MNLTDLYDITIIGGGPIGLFTAFYAGLRQAKTKIIESLDDLGGQPSHLYPEKIMHDIPAYPTISGEQLGEQLQIQIERFNPAVCLGEEALEIRKVSSIEGHYFEIKTTKMIHATRTIIIAAGNGAFSPRKLSIDNSETYEGTSLLYYVNHLECFRNKNVAISGGGDSAVDWALTLEPIANKVYLIHRRNKFRALESSVATLYNSDIITYTPYVPTEIKGDGTNIESLVINKSRTTHHEELDIDYLIISYGFTSSIGSIRNWNLALERGGIKVDSQFQSSIPGIYAIGDMAYYDGKVKLIATGFGEAPQAVNSALLHIDPNTNVAPIHSTGLE